MTLEQIQTKEREAYEAWKSAEKLCDALSREYYTLHTMANRKAGVGQPALKHTMTAEAE